MVNELQKIPSVDAVLRDPLVEELCNIFSRSYVTNTIRTVLTNFRTNMKNGTKAPDISEIISDIEILFLKAICCIKICLLYTSQSQRDATLSRNESSGR